MVVGRAVVVTTDVATAVVAALVVGMAVVVTLVVARTVVETILVVPTLVVAIPGLLVSRCYFRSRPADRRPRPAPRGRAEHDAIDQSRTSEPPLLVRTRPNSRRHGRRGAVAAPQPAGPRQIAAAPSAAYRMGTATGLAGSEDGNDP